MQLFSPSPGRNDNNRNGGSSCSSQSQSDGDYEQRDSGASFVVSKVGQQEMLVTPDGLSGDWEDYTISTDVSYAYVAILLTCTSTPRLLLYALSSVFFSFSFSFLSFP